MTNKRTPRASAMSPPRITRDHAWLADRARNALRHPVRIAAVAVAVFLTSLVALVVVPRQQRLAADRLPELASRVDTGVLLVRDATVRSELTATEHAVDSLRAALAELDSAEEAAATARSADRGVRATTRDSLTVLLAELTRLIGRVASAPLVASYRALADGRAIAGDTRVRALADSLAQIERRREAFGAVGGVDPTYVALTAQAAAIGRTLGEIAERRRVALRYQLAAASTGAFADAPALAGLDSVRATLDTVTTLARVDSLRQLAAATARQLGVARATNTRIMADVAAARARANIATPPVATIAATIALGVVLGILISMLVETTSPRLSGAAEVERVLGVQVLGTLEASGLRPASRGVSLSGAVTLDGTATRVVRRLLSIGAAAPRVAVIGDNAELVATVVMALAVAAAADARAVLLVDTDPVHAPLSRRLRLQGAGGVTDVITGTVQWPDTLIAHVGSHSLAIDIIPPGPPIARAPHTASVEHAGATLAAYAAAWDLVLFAVTSVDRPIVDVLLAHAGVGDAIVCARAIETGLATVVAEHRAVEHLGFRHRGVILANRAVPGDEARATNQAVVPAR